MTKNTSELIATNKHYVETVAKQYLNQGLTLEQLIEEGNKGLAKAAERYDPDKGYAFMSYAIWWVRQSILQALVATQRGEPTPQEEQLTARERGILRSIEEGETIEQIATDRKLTVERVKQIKEQTLLKQKTTRMKESLERMKTRKCIYLGKVLDVDMEYGTFPDLDELVDSEDPKLRRRIAEQGYGLDKLKDDPDPSVRAVIAQQGYYPQQFIKDSSEIVRNCARKILG